MDNSAPPQTVNSYASALNRVLSSLIETAGEGEVEALIFASAPTFFAIPVIGVSKFGTFFYQVAAKTTTKIIVDVQADHENSVVKNQGGALQDAIENKDPEAIKNASQNLEDAWGDLIHSDGGAVP